MSSDPAHPACLPIDALLAECEVRRERRSGPGGQHRNKVETAVVLRHRPTGVRAEASERRSQEQNRQQAVERLRLQLAVDLRLPLEQDGDWAPSPLWQQRAVGGRLQVSTEHTDFPALLAEALDVLAACRDDLPAAAQALGVSASQLTRFLARESRAWQVVNQQRRARGLRPLK